MHFSKIILGLFLSSDILVLHSCSLPQEHTRFLDKIQSLLSVLGKYLDGAVLMIKDAQEAAASNDYSAESENYPDNWGSH
ncbi:hypothetical protein PVAP13_8KG084200 [Panicum virgatum]|uniref:Uncharacterized protein n=1 Tax=Panicum virgatum TaxID=38727 RepID=A0A8T0PHY4_PANVG|nr:hypothetical protein PVAP13_8KG084200 [Panicum virgatum]